MAYVFPLPGWHGSINLHHGTDKGASDLFADRGTPVVSITAGRVSWAGNDVIGGNNVGIEGRDGLSYYYAHLNSTPAVRTGDSVDAGSRIGVVGDTGNAAGTGTHLHIGIGYGIATGAGAHGGAGDNFDAVDFLRKIYAGTPVVITPPDASGIATPVADGGVGGAISGAASGAAMGVLSAILRGFSSLVGRQVSAPLSSADGATPISSISGDTSGLPAGYNVRMNYYTPADNPVQNFTTDPYYDASGGEIGRWENRNGPRGENNRARLWRWIREVLGGNFDSAPASLLRSTFVIQLRRLKRDMAVEYQSTHDPIYLWENGGYAKLDKYLGA